MPEYKVKWMVGSDTIKGVKFDHLIQWNQIFDKRTYVVIKFTQVDIDSLNNPVQKFFQLFHNGSLLKFTFFHGVEYRRKSVRQTQYPDNFLIPGDQQ